MADLLFKHLGRKDAVVAKDVAGYLEYEKENPQYAKEIAPLVSNTYEVGVEVEIERIHRHSVNAYPVWQVKADGSLRDHGFEYVSTPIKGPRIHYALNQFFGVVNKGYNFSPRTSIHVHVNVLDLTPPQIAGMMLTYAPFERLLYRFVGGDRERSNFCVPFSDIYGPGDILRFFLTEPFRMPNLQEHRYLGLNPDAVRKFGTLEFRHLGGTDDKEKIVKWINLIFCLKKYAAGNAFEDIKARIDRLNTDSAYTAFLNDVFDVHGWALDSRSLQKDMEQAVTRIKKLPSTNTLWLGLKPSEKSVWYNYFMTYTPKKNKDVVFGAPVVPRVAARRARPFEVHVAPPVAPQPVDFLGDEPLNALLEEEREDIRRRQEEHQQALLRFAQRAAERGR